MARPRKMRVLNEAKSQVIAENVLKQNPEGLEQIDMDVNSKIVISKHIPAMRRVIFLNGRDPGYPLDFHYASATHPLKIYKLIHGQEYNLPEEIIEHLESCAEPQYAYRKGLDGHPQMYIESRKYIFQLRNAPRKAA